MSVHKILHRFMWHISQTPSGACARDVRPDIKELAWHVRAARLTPTVPTSEDSRLSWPELEEISDRRQKHP